MPRTAEQQRAYAATPEGRAKIRESNRRWRAKNPRAGYARASEYNREHPEKIRISSNRYRAKKLLIEDSANTFDELDWRELLNQYDNRCAYCLAYSNIEIEHKIPLIRGGPNTKANVVPACRACNRSKKDQTVEEWRHRRDRASA